MIHIFRALCINNKLDEAKSAWSNLKLNEYDKYTHMLTTFIKTCIAGHLDVAKWLYSLDEVKTELFEPIANSQYMNIYDEYRLNDIFSDICENNHIELAKWYYSVITEITGNILYIQCNILNACLNNKLELAEWLYSLSVSDSTHNYLYISKRIYHNIFIDCCEANNIVSAQWIYNKYNKYDDDTFNNAYNDACKNGHLEIAQWLQSLYRKQ